MKKILLVLVTLTAFSAPAFAGQKAVLTKGDCFYRNAKMVCEYRVIVGETINVQSEVEIDRTKNASSLNAALRQDGMAKVNLEVAGTVDSANDVFCGACFVG